jgi:hypothetical protein
MHEQSTLKYSEGSLLIKIADFIYEPALRTLLGRGALLPVGKKYRSLKSSWD